MRMAMSYEVEFVESSTDWADRWDVYLIGAPDDDIHYFSIVNSLMIVLFLTAAVSTIMVRTLRKDIALYNEIQTLEGTCRYCVCVFLIVFLFLFWECLPCDCL